MSGRNSKVDKAKVLAKRLRRIALSPSLPPAQVHLLRKLMERRLKNKSPERTDSREIPEER